jgi:hypothetical protein
MIGLAGLCNSILNPVDLSHKLTDGTNSITKAKVKQRLGPEPKPFYSPIWAKNNIGPGRRVISIKFEGGERLKRCPQCEIWKSADTESFSIDRHQLIGISSRCRCCSRKNQRKTKA